MMDLPLEQNIPEPHSLQPCLIKVRIVAAVEQKQKKSGVQQQQYYLSDIVLFSFSQWKRSSLFQ